MMTQILRLVHLLNYFREYSESDTISPEHFASWPMQGDGSMISLDSQLPILSAESTMSLNNFPTGDLVHRGSRRVSSDPKIRGFARVQMCE